MIINDLVNPVIYKLRQRFDLVQNIPYYIAVALVDLSQNIEFEELKQTGPLANFVVNQAEYSLLNNPFTANTEHKITFIDSWFVYFDTSGIISPGVSTGKEINKRDLRVVEPMSKILGLPTVYTLQGEKRNNGTVIVGFMPDNPYACQMRYQRQHPFKIPYNKVLQSLGDQSLLNSLASSDIFLPDDWSDVIVYYAAEKACDDNGMTEIGQNYHQKLFGYKDKRGSDMPGLINVKQTQQERNTIFNSRALKVIVRPTCRRG